MRVDSYSVSSDSVSSLSGRRAPIPSIDGRSLAYDGTLIDFILCIISDKIQNISLLLDVSRFDMRQQSQPWRVQTNNFRRRRGRRGRRGNRRNNHRDDLSVGDFFNQGRRNGRGNNNRRLDDLSRNEFNSRQGGRGRQRQSNDNYSQNRRQRGRGPVGDIDIREVNLQALY